MAQTPSQLPKESSPEQRGAERFALMLRASKLVHPSGEFLCILRDVSATGIKARLFHDLPTKENLLLELGNGERFPIEPVWERDDHAGFRFQNGPIDVQALIEESSPHPRRQIRINLCTPIPVLLHAAGMGYPAELMNISQNGAMIVVSSCCAISLPVRLEASGLPMLEATVRWRKGAAHGLVFQKSFKLDELARLALELQTRSVTSLGKAVHRIGFIQPR